MKMNQIKIELNSPIHKAAMRYEKKFGYHPRRIDGGYFIGRATEEEVVAEVDRCIRENEEMDFWFGYNEEDKERALNGPFYDPPPKTR